MKVTKEEAIELLNEMYAELNNSQKWQYHRNGIFQYINSTQPLPQDIEEDFKRLESSIELYIKEVKDFYSISSIPLSLYPKSIRKNLDTLRTALQPKPQLSDDVEDVIKSIRDSNKYIEPLFLNGKCYNFYKILKSIYPNSKAYSLNGIHVITKIDGNYFDIRGKYYLKEHDVLGKVSQELKNGINCYIYEECPICEEPVMFEFTLQPKISADDCRDSINIIRGQGLDLEADDLEQHIQAQASEIERLKEANKNRYIDITNLCIEINKRDAKLNAIKEVVEGQEYFDTVTDCVVVETYQIKSILDKEVKNNE